MNINTVFERFQLDEGALQDGLTLISAKELLNHYAPPFPPSMPALIWMVEMLSVEELAKLIKVLTLNYHLEHCIRRLVSNQADASTITLSALSEQTGVEAIYLPSMGAHTSVESFQEIVAQLRSPQGCPWDREQTHQSLRPFILEESYEMVDAIDQDDIQGMTEELGDVLLQILLHAQVGVEADEFRLGDVFRTVGEKMIRRHPHVFSTVKVGGDVSKVLRNWQDIKEEERKTNGDPIEKGILDGVPKSMSALLQAQSYQGRAAVVGFDWDSIEGVLEKVEEEVAEIRSAETEQERAEEIGDLLFALVNLTRWLDLDAESTLRKTNLKFRNRFAYVEKRARETGQKMTRMSLAEMDQFWDEAKQNGI